MKIEDGKTYMDGEGTIVGPLKPYRFGGYSFQAIVEDERRLYTKEGYFNGTRRCSEDLVDEYHEPDGDFMAYTEQDNDGEIMPLLDIFKPIRSKSTHWNAQFLARANDGSYLFEVGGDFRHPLRLFSEDVDKEFENVPEEE